MNDTTPGEPAAPRTRETGFGRLLERLSMKVGLSRFVFAGAAILVLALWASIHTYLEFERKAKHNDGALQLANYARAFEEHTIRTIRVLDQTTLFVRHEYQRLGSKLDLVAYGRGGTFLDQFYNLIGVAEPDGWVRLMNPPLPPSNVKDREHFKVHVEQDSGNLFISKPVLGRSSGKWAIQFTRRINQPDGSFGGVVVTSLDPGYFAGFYKSLDLGKGSVATLVGLDGIIRVRYAEGSTEIGQDVSKSQLFEALKKSSYGLYQTASLVDGKERFYAYRKLKDYPLVVVVGSSNEEMLSEFYEHRKVLFSLGLAMTMLILIAAFFLNALLRYQQRVQDALRNSEREAVSSSRMKSEFLARMAHELRTPLNGILGFSEYLRDNAQNPEHRDYAGTIHDAGNHLLTLVNATLDLAKIEAGRMELSLKPEPLEALVSRVVTLHTPLASRKGIAMQTTVAPDLPASIVCDATKVAQVLNNLVHNATKFTNSGRVTVSVERGGGEPPEVQFSVTDTGPGIPEESLGLLFDRFRQLDTFNTRSHEGSGLGLALAKELVELMGGRIRVESKPGSGAKFLFTLPLRTQ